MQIIPITEIDIRLVPGPWPLTADMRAAVSGYWRAATAANPHLWDGRILGLCAPGGGPVVIRDGVLEAEAREDDYSAFMLWRDRGFPDIGTTHAFVWALIVSADGAIIYGRMGAETANSGRVYPPGGSLEPRDIRADGTVDVLGAINLELIEETGLDAADASAGIIVAVLDGARLSVGRVLRFPEDADDLMRRIRANLALQEHRELADVIAIRTRSDAERAGAVPYAVAVADAFASGTIR